MNRKAEAGEQKAAAPEAQEQGAAVLDAAADNVRGAAKAVREADPVVRVTE